MDDEKTDVPPQTWLEALAESRADADAGRIVSSDAVHANFRQRLYDAFGKRVPVAQVPIADGR